MLQTPHGMIRMCEIDIQETARFVREFVTMSLIPWMEKCVVEWNENVSDITWSTKHIFQPLLVFFVSQTSIAALLDNPEIVRLADRASPKFYFLIEYGWVLRTI